MMRVGFAGLGLMGVPMAQNIMKAGFELTVWNRTKGESRSSARQGRPMGRNRRSIGRPVRRCHHDGHERACR